MTDFDLISNHAISRLAQPHNPGDGVLVVQDATGFVYPSRVTCFQGIGSALTDTVFSILTVTGITGNTLTIGEAVEGTTDVVLPAQIYIQQRSTAGQYAAITTAINNLENGSGSGSQGQQGPQGPQGYQGYQGSQGSQGAQGAGGGGSGGSQGAQGPQGYQGTTGSQGAQGPQGYQGTTGSQGAQGAQGAGGGGGGSPGGSTGDVQVNSGGEFAGYSALTWNGSQLIVSGTNGFGSIACDNPNTSGSKRAGFTLQANGNVYWFVAQDYESNGTTDFFIYDTQVRFYIGSGNGKVGIGTSTPSAQVHTLIGSSGYVGQIIEAASGQTADLVQYQNSGGTVLSGVDQHGYLRSVLTTGAPTTTPATGSMAFDASANKLWIYNGSAWVGTVLS